MIDLLDDCEHPHKERRLTRAHTSVGAPGKGRENVLPPVCIICKKTKYTYNRERKRNVEKLKRVETFTAGRLLEAAQLKERHDILVHLEGAGRDLPALEPRCCYMNLKRFLSKPPKEMSEESLYYQKAYEKFFESIVVPKIIEAKEILLLTSLRESFIMIVKQVEGVDTSYRTSNLKQRMSKSYPQLQFTLAMPLGYIVYSGAYEASDLVRSALGQIDIDHDSQESEEDGSPHNASSAPQQSDPDELLTNFMSSQIVKNAVQDSLSTFHTPWPPTAEILNINTVKALVPHQLFNWIAWTTGLNENPQADTYVTVKEVEKKKILAIAQDIMYLKANGRIATPKHHALSMTVRHMTGSSQLINILNGLGHSSSYSATLEHDTALALVELSRGELPVPKGIMDGLFTTMVWDNIDFGEETLSGKGTTHSTNGIIIQRKLTDEVMPNQAPAKSIPKKKQRSVQAPSTRLEPFYGTSRTKDGPECIGKDIDIESDPHCASRVNPKTLDQAYIMTRIKAADEEKTTIPSWTGFNTLLSTNIPRQSIIGYLPVIDASPTELETVKTILVRSVQYADLLHLAVIVLVFDQAIYAKAQKIIWGDNDDELKKRLVVRLGSFHTKMSYLACIGQRYKDAGLSDIFVESGLVVSGSLAGVMNGKHYNRGVRAHKLASEAFQRLRFLKFLESIPEEESKEIQDLISKLYSTFPTKDYREILEDQKLSNVISAYDQFNQSQIQKNGNFAFWSSYIGMVEELLLFIRATREGNWLLHLSAVRNMLPWYFTYNRINYSRYLTAYYLEMCDLPKTHPDIHEKFMSGEFCVQRQSSHGFAQVECDLTIEQTCNRDSKTKGGLTGFTQHKGAVHRWILSQPARAAITNECKVMAGQNFDSRTRR